jgi:hypothetical protein
MLLRLGLAAQLPATAPEAVPGSDRDGSVIRARADDQKRPGRI